MAVEKILETGRAAVPFRANIARRISSSSGSGASGWVWLTTMPFTSITRTNLEELERQGFDLIRFSPMDDLELPPDIDGIYIGGAIMKIRREAGSKQGYASSLQDVSEKPASPSMRNAAA